MAVAAAVLAAGRGARTGEQVPKPLLELRGRPLVVWSLDAAHASGLRPVLLVVGRHGKQVAEWAPPATMIVPSRRWRRGIARSLRVAVQAFEGWVQVTAVCIGLADQPLVSAEAYRRLAAAHEQGAQLAVATYDGQRRNPVLLARRLWPEVRDLDGDVGARALFKRHEVVEVDCSDTGDPSDVDTLADLEALERRVRDHEQGDNR